MDEANIFTTFKQRSFRDAGRRLFDRARIDIYLFSSPKLS